MVSGDEDSENAGAFTESRHKSKESMKSRGRITNRYAGRRSIDKDKGKIKYK